MQTTAPDHPVIRKMELYGELEPDVEIEEEKPSVLDDIIDEIEYSVQRFRSRIETYQEMMDDPDQIEGVRKTSRIGRYEATEAKKELEYLLEAARETKRQAV